MPTVRHFAFAVLLASCGVSDLEPASPESAQQELEVACVHPVNVAGVKLVAACSSCATTVCSKDAYCCNSAWDSLCVSEASSWCGVVDAGAPPQPPVVDAGTGALCSHPVTVSGTKLAASCSTCAAAVCAKDPYCCNSSWDGLCVSEVSQYCTASAPDAGTPAPPDAGTAPAAGLANGSFESGLSGWAKSGNVAAYAGGAWSGSYSAAFQPVYPTLATLAQTLTVPAGTTTLVFRYRVQSLNATSLAANLRVTMGSLNTVFASNLSSSMWTQASFNVSASAGKSVTLTFQAANSYVSSDPTFYVDAIAFQ